MDKQVKVLPYIMPLRSLKHVELVGHLRISANKKRKHDKALLKIILEAKTDTQVQFALDINSRDLTRRLRAAFYTAKYQHLAI